MSRESSPEVCYDDGTPVTARCEGCREGGNWHCAGTAPLCLCACGVPGRLYDLDTGEPVPGGSYVVDLDTGGIY